MSVNTETTAAREVEEPPDSSFSASDWAEWDAQIKRDAASGKLGKVLAKSKEEKDEDWCSLFSALPSEIKEIALKNYEILKTNPYHSSLHFSRIGCCWSVHAGHGYRAMATELDKEFIWSWIGNRADYDRWLDSVG